MKLVIQTPGNTEEFVGTQRHLVKIVKADLEDRGLSESSVRRHLFSLGIMVGGIGGTNVMDDEGNLRVGYRITR